MNSRELFHEIMNFNRSVRPLKWSFGYWGSTVKKWYEQGLTKKEYPKIPTEISTISYSLYTTVWTHKWEKTPASKAEKIELPDGIVAWGGANCHPNQGMPLATDVMEYFNFDKTGILVEVEQLFYPPFEIEILEENEKFLIYIDLDGVKRRFQKKEATIPTFLDSSIKDWKSWCKVKEEKLTIENIKDRFPKNWNDLVKIYRNRDYPLYFGGYPLGLFGTLAHLLGYKHLFLFYYDHPDLIRDMLNTFTELWISVWEEVLSFTSVDAIHIWEDISMGRGSMVSPSIIKEFMVPHYKRIADFLKGKGVNIIMLDTDGDCNELIPIFLDAGINCLYPMEASAGMDVLAVRKRYPTLAMMGGVPKSEIALGKEHIDKMLEPIEILIKEGGYIPCGDHSIPPEVSWKNYKYYREKLNHMIYKIK
ncbi:MAG: hypothetical protein FJW69_03370 [Actinobacteria bacterium]|nr:hypothetical protein [Actinomycetota bacterium]MBM3713048.1 hypothetical protein [Actinomycetota bacterium]